MSGAKFDPILGKLREDDTGGGGTQGDTGAKGDTGTHGDTGVGVKGDTGSTGATGSAGAKGDTGTAGAAGAKGDTGTTGATGSTGAKGDTGTTGSTGAKGDTGTTGSAGAKGDTGSTGSAGAKGDTGSQGIQGDTGAGGAPGGSNTQVQYNNLSAFGGIAEFTYDNSTGIIVWNDAGNDRDFRMEGDTNPNLFMLDASTDRIGINVAAPLAKLNILSTTEPLRLSYDASNYVSFTVSSSGRLTQGMGQAVSSILGNFTGLSDGVEIYNANAASPGTMRVMPKGASYTTLEFYLFDFVADATNYARMRIDGNLSNSANVTLVFEKGGTKAVPALFLQFGGTNMAKFTNAGLFGFGNGNTTPTAIVDALASTTSVASLRLRAGTAPTSPNEGDMWNDSTRKTMMTFAAGAKQHLIGSLFQSTADASISNSTTETSIVGSGTGVITLPANFLTVSKAIRITASGVLSTDAVPHTLQVKIKLGTTVILDTGAQTPIGALATRFWRVTATLICRSTGASGSVIGQSVFEFMTAATGNPTCWEMTNTAAVTVATNATKLVGLTAQWGTGASASDIIKCTNFSVEALN